jgi:hypothetical protein
MGLELRFLCFCFVGVCMSSCSSFITKSNASLDQIWVYVELETSNKKDTTIYYFYGKMNQSIYDEIDRNPKAAGLFVLSDVRYIRKEDDLLAVYEDEETFGNLVFRIEDIVHMTLFKKDPVFIFELDELHDSALQLRKLRSNMD